MQDAIDSIFVVEKELHITSSFVYTMYEGELDKNYFLPGCRIHHMIPLFNIENNSAAPVLACADRVIRRLEGTKCDAFVSTPR